MKTALYQSIGRKVLVLITVLSFFSFNIFSQQAKWTIMVYLDADNNLEDAGIDDINEMEVIGSSEEVNILVQFDRIEGYDETNNNWTDTRRFRILQDKNDTIISTPPLETPGELNMGDPQTLTDFINWSATHYPADQYVLILWNHGGGWYKSLDLGANKQERAPFKDVCYDDTDDDYLSNVEVGQAIAASNIHIDMLAYDACLMGMIEVAYQTRNTTDVIVSSEELVPWDGFEYTGFMGSLVSNPDMSLAELGRSIVSSYSNEYPEEVTLSVMDQDGVGDIANKLDSLTKKIIENGDVWDTVGKAWQGAQQFNFCYIDIGSFANEFSLLVQNPELKQAAVSLSEAMTNAALAIYGSTTYPEASGLTIYFPPTAEDYEPQYAESGRAFADSTNWVSFLEAFHKEYYFDWDEPNNHFANATPISDPGNHNKGQLKDINDIDIYRIFYDGNTSETSVVSINPPADFDLYLYSVIDTVITKIDSSKNSGLSEEVIELTNLDTGYYYFVVKPIETSKEIYYLEYTGLMNSSPVDYLNGTPITLAFDDGNPGTEYYSIQADRGIGMKFQSESILTGIWYYIADMDAVEGGGDLGHFSLSLFDINWNEPVWGFEDYPVQPDKTGWNFLDLSETYIYSYELIIGFKWDGDNTPSLGTDSLPCDNAAYQFDGENWVQAEDSVLFFIRPVFANPMQESEICYCDLETMVLTDPAGSFSDGSGDYFYGNNCLCSWLIRPENAISISLNIEEFNTEEGFDYLFVYDGNSDSAPLIVELDGLITDTTLVAESGEMYLQFITDGVIGYSGWEVSYTCEYELIDNLINPDKLTEWSLYPNPGTGIINLQCSTAQTFETSVSIYNSTGQIIQTSIITPSENKISQDISKQSPGIYYIKINNNNGSFIEKYILK